MRKISLHPFIHLFWHIVQLTFASFLLNRADNGCNYECEKESRKKRTDAHSMHRSQFQTTYHSFTDFLYAFLCRLPNIVNTVFLFCLLHECYLFGSSLSRCSHNLCHIHLEMCHFDTEYVWWQFGFSLRYGNIAVYFHPAPPSFFLHPSAPLAHSPLPHPSLSMFVNRAIVWLLSC